MHQSTIHPRAFDTIGAPFVTRDAVLCRKSDVMPRDRAGRILTRLQRDPRIQDAFLFLPRNSAGACVCYIPAADAAQQLLRADLAQQEVERAAAEANTIRLRWDAGGIRAYNERTRATYDLTACQDGTLHCNCPRHRAAGICKHAILCAQWLPDNPMPSAAPQRGWSPADTIDLDFPPAMPARGGYATLQAAQ